MTSGLIVVIVESMMTGTIIMRVIAGNTGAEALDIGEEEVEVLEEGGVAVQPQMAVKRDVLELSNGTGRRKSKCIQIKLTLRKTMATCKMVMSISSKSNNLGREDMDTDLCMFYWWYRCTVLSYGMCFLLPITVFYFWSLLFYLADTMLDCINAIACCTS